MATDKRQFTLRLQENNFFKIKHIAEQNKRSMAMEIEHIIEKYITSFEKENGNIKITED